MTGAAGGRMITVVFETAIADGDDPARGGEFLITGRETAERAGHLAPVAVPGGAAAITQPWRMAAAYLDAAGVDTDALPPGVLDVRDRNTGQWSAALAMTRRRINAPLTASAGVLFGAVAALLDASGEPGDGGGEPGDGDGRRFVDELERLADPAETGAYPAAIGPYRPPSREYRAPAEAEAGATFAVTGADLVRAVFDDLVAGIPRPAIAARFHYGVAAAIEAACSRLREHHGTATVGLRGDLFGGTLLRDAAVSRLEARGFEVVSG